MHSLTGLTTHERIEGTQDLLSTRTDALLLLSSGDSFRTLLTRVTEDLDPLPSRLRGMPDAEIPRGPR